MYVVKRCDNWTYGRNKWVDIHVTPDKADAEAYAKAEYRLLLVSDPNLDTAEIERRVGWFNVYGYQQRSEVRHGKVALAVVQSNAEKYDNWNGPVRPERTAMLDKILGS